MVTNFSPAQGPVSGKYVVTFTGTDLDSVSNPGVSIDGLSATLVSNPPQPTSLQVQLPKVSAAGIAEEGTFAPFYLGYGNYNLTVSFFQFFNDPVISDFNPKTGNLTGGVVIFIEGTDLNRGQTPIVTVSGVPCTVTSAGDTLVKCTTGKVNSTSSGLIILTLGSVSATSQATFAYNEAGSGGTPIWVIPVVVVISFLVLVAIIVGVIFYRKQVKKGNKKSALLFAELDKANGGVFIICFFFVVIVEPNHHLF